MKIILIISSSQIARKNSEGFYSREGKLMNKIYKVIWSKVKNQYVVVSELAHSNGKQSRTAKRSLRSRIAALVVCGAIAAFGVFGITEQQAFAATGAETSPGQYVAIVVGNTDTGFGSGITPGDFKDSDSDKFGNDYYWNERTQKWTKCGNTRTFIDARGESHTYVKQTENNKTYWVREGYTISIVEHNRFESVDKDYPDAPQNSFIIDSVKNDNADSEGLISSSEVLVTKDEHHTTLTGNKLNQIDAGIYGGATNEGGTKAPIDYHYFINNNDKGYVNIGRENEWDEFTNTNSKNGYFQEVYSQNDGTYNTKKDGTGITVSSEYLYAIDATPTDSKNESDVRLGAFFNSDGSVYTGEVYGNGNEVLMTGYDESTGKYYSYWGTKITDRKMSLANMTVGDLLDIKAGLEGSIYTAQGDDIKEVKVEANKTTGKGGTIGLVRRGDYIGDDEQGNPIYKETDPVPGTITISNTVDSGKNGNDVAIRFGSIGENGQDVEKFTVDAGSKVVGTKGGNVVPGKNDTSTTIDGLEINGQKYSFEGTTYTDGAGIAIDNNEISVDLAENSGLHFDGDKLANNLKVTNYEEPTDTEANKNGGNWTITENDGKTTKTLTNTTLSSDVGEKEITNEEEGDKKVIYGKDYTISDTDGNTATLSDVASASKLANVDTRLSTTEGYITEINDTLKGAVMYDYNEETKDYNKNLVKLDGEDYKLGEGENNPTGGTRLTNVAYADVDGNNTGSDAVNVDLLKDYVAENGGGSWNLTTNGGIDKEDKAVSIGKEATVDFSGVKETIGEGEDRKEQSNIVVSKEFNKETNTTSVKFDLSDDLNVTNITAENMTVENTTDVNNSVVNVGYFKDNERHIATSNDIDPETKKNYSGEYTVDNGEVNLTEVDGNGKATGNTLKITGVASKSDVDELDKFAVRYDSKDGNPEEPDYTSITLGNGENNYNSEKKQGGTHIYNVAYADDNLKETDPNKYGSQAVNVDYLNDHAGDLITGNNNLKVHQDTAIGTDGGAKGNNGGNWYVTDKNQTSGEEEIKFTNTTLSSTVTSDKEITNDKNKEDEDFVSYGKDQIITDTDGNTATISDVASADKLKDIDINKIGNLQYNDITEGDSDKTSIVHNNDNVTVAIGKLDNSVTNLTSTVNEGWTAQAGEDKIPVNPTEVNGEKQNTLNFVGDNNISVTANEENRAIEVALEDDITLDDGIENGNKVQLSGTNGTISAHNSEFKFGGTGNYDNANDMTFDQNGLTVTNTQTMRENDETTTSSTVINGGSITTGNVTAGGITVNADNGGTVNGLTNKTWDAENYISGQAATEDQLKEAVDDIEENDYDGWKVSANGTENGVDVTTGSTVDFSNTDGNIVVGQKDTNLTFDLNPVVTLDGNEADNNKVVLDGNNGTISVTNKYVDTDSKPVKTITNTFNFNNEGATFTNTTKNGKGNGNGNAVTSFTKIDGGTITVSSDARKDKKDIVIDGDTGEITGLSNTEWEGTTTTPDRAATEGQLQDVATEAAKHTTVSGDKNITVKHEEDSQDYQVTLNDKVYLGGDHTEDSHNIVLDGDRGVIGLGSTIALDGRDGTAVIGGVNIDTVYDEATSKPSSTITGLSNTTWTDEIATAAADKKSEAAGTAATQGQLGDVASDLSDQITNSGWTASTNNGAVTTDITNGDKVDFANTDGNIAVNQTAVKDDKGNITGTNLTFDLNPDITLDDDVEDGNSVQLSGTNGTINAHNSELIFGGTGKYDNVNDMTFNQNGLTITNTQTMRDTGETTTSSTVINGGSIATGNITAGGITVNADNGGTVNGLTNKTWDADNYVSGQAATEDQLKSVSDKVNAGWIATDNNGNQITVNPKDNTLNFSGDRNVTVTANKEDGSIDVALNNEVQLGDFDNGTGVYLSGASGTISATNSISVGMDQGLVIDGNKKTINGLSNTTWDPENYVSGQAATEDQLQEAAAASKTTLSNGTNTNVTSTEKADGHIDYQVNLNKNINLNDRVYINGDPVEGNKTIVDIKSGDTSKEESIFAVEDKGNGSISIGGIDVTNVDGPYLAVGDGKLKFYKDGGLATGNATGTFSVRPDGDLEISGKNSSFNVDAETGNVNAVNSSGSAIMMNDDSVALNASGNGVAISDEGILLNTNGIDEDIKLVTKGTSVSVDNDGATFTNTNTNETTNIDGGTINVGDRLMVEEDGSIYATNNNGSTVMINDNGVALNSEGNGVVVSGEGITLNTNGSAVTVDRFNGATFTNTNTTESTNINGANITAGEGENQIKINGAPKADDPALSVGTDKFVVGQDGSLSVSDKFNVDAETGNINAVNSNGSAIMMNDDSVALNASGNGVAISNEGITLNANGSAVTVDRFNGTTFTNTNTGETTNINGDIITTDTVKGLSNTTWDDELATQVANSEELQGTAATQGQLQQAVSAVATEAAKQHTTVSGDDNLTVKSSVNENGGTNYQVTLDDDITLGNPKAGNTEGERSFTINTTDPEGYVPESYETGSGADFIKENGGFMLFATDTQGYGVFGVTAKGSAWAKDFKTYTTDIYGNNTQYSLNDVGDAVAQMSSYYNKENGKSYTVFSRYLNEAEKDNPFETVDDATRDIPLALRDDGAVLIGATIKDDDFTDNGIRINAETDADGNNKATITGLENTEWKPPTPVATFAANDINTTSRAATEAQLDDLYSAVAAYDVNVDGTIDYSHIALAGAPYGASRAGNGTPTGGTSITNVAYASGNDGSEAVNVDYLKDAIKDAVKDGPVSSNEKHLDTSKTYTPDKTTGKITIAEVDGTGQTTGNQLVINDVASKAELDSLKTNVGDLNYDKVTGDKLVNGDSVTTAIGKLDNKIDNISGTATDAANNTVTGGTIKDDGTISLTQKDGGTVALDGKLTDSGVVQDGTKFDGETGTLTITSQDKYNKGTSSVTVSGIASKNDIGTVKDTIGATSKEDLKDAYKDADKDGNATTEYITDSETMVDADVALDHAVQDVANTSYANDMILSNRIDNVESRLGDVEERIDKVGAMAAAIANLRTMGYDPEAPTEVAVGVGQYKSETGIALGIFHYPNQDFMLSASISTSGDEVMGGIGATWRIGRKSAEEKAKDEEERILAKAEEIKQAAKRAEVKEQAERHAKLLAEREAKGEPIVPVEESAEQAQA